MYVMRNLNLLGFLPKEEDEQGSTLVEQATAAGSEAPQREREPKTPFPLTWATAPFSLNSLAAAMDVLLEIFRRLC